MDDLTIERAIALLGDAPRVTVPVAALARCLGCDPDTLARRLGVDARCRVLEPPARLVISALPDDRRAAYELALRRLGLWRARRVALVQRPWRPDADVAELLRQTTARLLASGTEGSALATVAERANRAVSTTLAAGA